MYKKSIIVWFWSWFPFVMSNDMTYIHTTHNSLRDVR